MARVRLRFGAAHCLTGQVVVEEEDAGLVLIRDSPLG